MLMFSWVALGGIARPLHAAPKAPPSEAKMFYDKATAAFALGQYLEAAENYEQAFRLKPDPALLYNTAQAYRLGGNNKRALELYRSYMRVFPDGAAQEEAAKHAESLTQKLAEADAPKSPAPASPREPARVPPAPQDAPAPTMLVAAPEPQAPAQETSMFSRPVFWIVTGVVVVAAAVGIGLLASGDKDPSPTLGRIGGAN